MLGRLSGLGIIHSAPIPLFHNRVQAGRRRDLGLYEWFRAGRLDRWLESCAYPNMGATGLRDFEHLEVFKGSNMKLYRSIGNHFLSLFLVTGSFFRNKKRDRVGLDHNGNPVDVRYLFEGKVLKERWMNDEDILRLTKGKSDITLLTGPHLGGFNRPISLPEMIECISTMSALCMVGKFWKEAETRN